MYCLRFALTLQRATEKLMANVVKKTGSGIAKVLLSVVLGGAILYWMYRDQDFRSIRDVMLHEMDWTWMWLSLPFGVLAQMFRGWRWRQTLEPLGEHPRTGVSVNAIFLSYAVSLVIPRIGEFVRCGVLKRYDGVSFPKALGTVVTERVIDSLLVGIITLTVLLMQFKAFDTFFDRTGMTLDGMLHSFTTTGYIVTAVCAAAAVLLVWYLLKSLSVAGRIRQTIAGIWQGVLSLGNVKNVPLFIMFTLAIWASYFIHYYLTFFCFDATSHLGLSCALVTFIVGSIAVIVPTPNGAGPWHFAVKTMLILYGVADNAALAFVLIVHTVQTLLVVLLGVWAWAYLSMTKRKTK